MDLSADIQSELTSTIAKLQLQARSSLVSAPTQAALSGSAGNLQNWYDEALTGGLTSADIVALQSDLNNAQKQSLAADAASDQKKLIIGGVVGLVLVVAGIIFYKVKMKKA